MAEGTTPSQWAGTTAAVKSRHAAGVAVGGGRKLTRHVGARLNDQDLAGLEALAGDFSISAVVGSVLRDRLRQPAFSGAEVLLGLKVEAKVSLNARHRMASDLTLRVGYNGSMKIWLNDALVRDLGPQEYVPGYNQIDITLRAGTNKLLIQIEQMNVDWGFSIEAVDMKVASGI